MSAGDVIVLGILAVITGRAAFSLYRNRGTCSCGACPEKCSGVCGSCTAACGKTQNDKNRRDS